MLNLLFWLLACSAKENRKHCNLAAVPSDCKGEFVITTSHPDGSETSVDLGVCFNMGNGEGICQPLCVAEFAGECSCANIMCPQSNMCDDLGEASEKCEPRDDRWLGAFLIIAVFFVIMGLAAVGFRQSEKAAGATDGVEMQDQAQNKAGEATSQTDKNLEKGF